MRQHQCRPNRSKMPASVNASGTIIVTVLFVLSAGGLFRSSAQNGSPAAPEEIASSTANGAYGLSSTPPVGRIRDTSDAKARACMRRIQEEARASSEIIEVVMTLVDPSGRTRKRRATFYQKLRSTTCMARLIRFHSPPEMAGAAVLALENVEREDDWWIYVPAYHVTRRIPSRNRSETFMGTDLSYEDLTDLRLDQYSFRFAGTDTIDGVACRLLEVYPTTSDTKSFSLYGKLVYWVEVSKPLYPKALFYGHDGGVLKEVRNSGAVRVGGQWRWGRMKVCDLRTNHRTIVDVQSRRVGQHIPDRVFTERALRRSG